MEDGFNKKERVLSLVSETGMLNDYCNEINGMVSTYMSGKTGEKMNDVISLIKKDNLKIKTYEERYPNRAELVNDKNRESVKKLDELVEHLNKMKENPDTMNENEFRKVCNDIYLLIYGTQKFKI